jgi:hypothetical protein
MVARRRPAVDLFTAAMHRRPPAPANDVIGEKRSGCAPPPTRHAVGPPAFPLSEANLQHPRGAGAVLAEPTSGDFVVHVPDESGEEICRSNPMRVTPAGPQLRHFWGDTHGQSNETLGTNTASEYFEFGPAPGTIRLARCPTPESARHPKRTSREHDSGPAPAAMAALLFGARPWPIRQDPIGQLSRPGREVRPSGTRGF